MPARASGILLHPTSLPSPYGIGDLGPSARQFLEFLADSDQQVWQVLPLGPTGFGNSPYLCYSAFAGNPALISPDLLLVDGLLTAPDLAPIPAFPTHQVDYDAVLPWKQAILRRAFEAYCSQPHALQSFYAAFCAENAVWLEDYALFMALKTAQGGRAWTAWPKELAQREPGALQAARMELAESIEFERFLQFLFWRQWHELKLSANSLGIRIVGDLPIYVAQDSADAWSHPEYFCLDPETGEPALMAGVPPDYFSATGQLWGNPVYNWAALQADGYRWWLERLKQLLEAVDIIRIDHFRGLESFWAVPQGEKTAEKGEWVEAPGADFLATVKQQLGSLPIIAEDLGVITPEVEALRDGFDLPGMKILQFAFDSGADNPYLPHNFGNHHWVVYTGTHDNDTTLGWFMARHAEEQARVLDYLGSSTVEDIHWQLIRLAWQSVAELALVPLQDVLGLGSPSRMNRPGEAAGNWDWRYSAADLTGAIAHRLAHLTRLYGRLAPPRPAPANTEAA
jgi:4-alpha-glucanotransferase